MVAPVLLFALTLLWILLTRRKYTASKRQYIPKRNKIVDDGVYNEQELTEMIEKMEQKYEECMRKYAHLSEEKRSILYGKYKRKLEWYKGLLKDMKTNGK